MAGPSTRLILSPIVRGIFFLVAVTIEVVIAVFKLQGNPPPITLEVIGHFITAVTGLFSVNPELRNVKASLTRQLSRQLSATQPSPDPDREMIRFLSAVSSQLSQPSLPDTGADAGPGGSLA